MKIKILLCLALLAFLSTSQGNLEAKDTRKFLVILQAGTQSHEGLARSLHALLYSQELHDHGHEVVLVFDGAGTQWVNEWNNPDSKGKYKALYEQLREDGITQVICDYCATAFQARTYVEKQKKLFAAEYQGHPSIAKWVDQGYEPIIL